MNKSIIARLSDVELSQIAGGASGSITMECCMETAQIRCLLRYIDIPTIGHDDGSYCISKKAAICHGMVEAPHDDTSLKITPSEKIADIAQFRDFIY